MAAHADLEAEQAHVDRAYQRLDQLRSDTQAMLRSVLDQGRGGTHQFREERDVIVRTSLARLDQLDIGDQALCFGRIDRRHDDGAVEAFHIGRLGVSGEELEPLVVDWRAPVAEPFYRATGREPMGLVLRRHLAAQGRQIVGLEDERFGRSDQTETAPAPGTPDDVDTELELGGPGALLAALEGARSGSMRDIVSTIQREQDEIIRSPLLGVFVVQGGPGTGKTAVALHRAAYLLYTHRFPLERQGVLVIGPNPLFLRYIEHVLPSLGESGVTLSTITGLVHGAQVRGEDEPPVARLKGEARMTTFVAQAVRSRQRALRHDAVVPFGSALLRLSVGDSAQVVSTARRRPGTHNSRRRFVEQMVVRRLADDYLRTLSVHGVSSSATAPLGTGAEPATGSAVGAGGENGHRSERLRHPGGHELNGATINGAHGDGVRSGPSHPTDRATPPSGYDGTNDVAADEASFDLTEFSRQVHRLPELAEALDRMWPRLSAEELLHDLFGAPPLLALAGKRMLSSAEQS
ncbi:MAG TPA: DNA/RNA helicase domain-containing protein, partial [Acidimicrobiales bacterium]|nr:DNA/RNA helicase domain-containing protein [Acidimicrobiales bacterium]